MPKFITCLLFLMPLVLTAQQFKSSEIKKWKAQARNVEIIRDNWGIPHVYGQTDADAVFGMLYAQCEDDFKRVEYNYIEKLGRLAEVKGKELLYEDLLNQVLLDTAAAISDYKTAPYWLQQLMNAYADGINYYIYKHPGSKPLLLEKFEPWFPLLWTDGSIGAINTAGISVKEFEHFYTANDGAYTPVIKAVEERTVGSNGFAIAPSKSATGNAMLYINPHVSPYFRPEMQVQSQEGLYVYGAVTWGQFFIYQGFNQFCGWMHTSSDADVADLYEEKISKNGNGFLYEYDGEQMPVKEKTYTIKYAEDGKQSLRTFKIYSTLHGPVISKRNGKWISLAANNRNMKSLIQSWQRTKSKSFEEYKLAMAQLANTSNNTVYADAAGNIAYWHGNFMPKRNIAYNWSLPVDGSTTATEWQGLHTVDEMPHLYNPPSGFLQNCNSDAYSAAGKYSLQEKNYPAYMAPDQENFRSIRAIQLLEKEKQFTLEKLIAAGYDTYISVFEELIPALIKAFDNTASAASRYTALAAPMDVLKKWDLHCSEQSVATTIAIHWIEKIAPQLYDSFIKNGTGVVTAVNNFAAKASATQLLDPLLETIKELQEANGSWEIPWGDLNRFQRINDEIDPSFNDSLPSLPIGFVSSWWGMLPSAESRYFHTKKRYAVYGNSFVCAVEFGKKIKAKSLLAGGESGDIKSPHFNDQSLMYTKGIFKEVLFYREDVLKHAEKKYHPGE